MRDIDIRSRLRSKLLDDHQHESRTLIVDEFVLPFHLARADVAVINGMLNGYEIKSGRDRLIRLPNQQEVYSKVFDRVTAVVEENHLRGLGEIIPDWWGILVASEHGAGVLFQEYRPAHQNEGACPLALAQMLWKDEAIAALHSIGITKGLAGKPRRLLWETLARSVDRPQISAIVRECLKARECWRADSLRT